MIQLRQALADIAIAILILAVMLVPAYIIWSFL